MAEQRIRRKREKHANKLNEKVKKFVNYEINEKVLLKANNISSAEKREVAKFFSNYKGPYVIKKKIHNNTFILKYIDSEKERGEFHARKLKHYYDKE